MWNRTLSASNSCAVSQRLCPRERQALKTKSFIVLPEENDFVCNRLWRILCLRALLKATEILVKVIKRTLKSPWYKGMCACSVAKSCPALWTPWTVACQASLSIGLSREEYCSGLLFPGPGDLLDPGIEPVCSAYLALAGRVFTTESPGKPLIQVEISDQKFNRAKNGDTQDHSQPCW